MYNNIMMAFVAIAHLFTSNLDKVTFYLFCYVCSYNLSFDK